MSYFVQCILCKVGSGRGLADVCFGLESPISMFSCFLSCFVLYLMLCASL